MGGEVKVGLISTDAYKNIKNQQNVKDTVRKQM